jgi:hypothetical protein
MKNQIFLRHAKTNVKILFRKIRQKIFNPKKINIINFLKTPLRYFTDSKDKLAKTYVREIVRLHGVPVSIVSNHDPLFTSKFWERLQGAMGTELNFSTVYYS